MSDKITWYVSHCLYHEVIPHLGTSLLGIIFPVSGIILHNIIIVLAKKLGPYSRHFIFFITYKWAQ